MNKHAYLIIAHNEPEVLSLLLSLLDDRRNDIYLHIDARSSNMYEQFKDFHLNKSKLYVLSHRIPVYWGDISQVEVEYLLFETALKTREYAYFHLLSGVDLPIKSQDYIHDFFHRYQGKEFVGFWNSAYHKKDLDRKVYRRYLFTKYFKGGPAVVHGVTAFLRNIFLILQKITKYRRHQEWTFKKGFNWVSITNEFCAYLVKQKPQVMKTFSQTLCPDEIFIQTVLWNSPFRQNIYNAELVCKGSMRAIDWERGNPYVWTRKNYRELKNSELLFARKFSSDDLPTRKELLEFN